MNPMRNEMILKLGSEEILLRPTFENMLATETKVGGLSYLAWRFTKVANKGSSMEEKYRNLPSLTEIATIIYLNQASTDPQDPEKKKLSMEKIWELVLVEGLNLMGPLTDFISIMAAGNKYQGDVSESEKKS